ncbi:hypothetical protein [Microbacterium sp. BH-3-3-3]|uniref:hypothetical protein n=1 Tax=Microbacterium sp. BH-3-3-3 TaxID=1906742 RepID=UPI0011A7CED4|nr:hypothetical protein [Microbacterium sp. BH-3-3-3]
MWWKRVVFWARVAAIVWVALVGLNEVLTFYKVYEPSPNLQPTIWLVSVLLLGVGSLGNLIGDAVRDRFAVKRGKLDSAMMSMIIELCADGSLRFDDLGGSVYKPAWLPRFVRDSSGEKVQRLKRVHRFRPSASSPPSGISWTARTGAVGECWSLRRPVYKDWHAVASRYKEPLTATEFARVSKATRNGFSLDQFNVIASKYSELLAVPVYDPQNDAKLIGVVSVDRLFDPDVAYTKTLDASPKKRLVFAASAAIGIILKPQAKTD